MATREKVTFPPNEPVTVTLQYPAGKIISGNFGEQVMWGLADGRVMFLDLAVAQKINHLDPQQGESFVIARRWNGQKGSKVVWDVWLSPETEKTRAAREVPGIERELRQSIAAANQRRYATLEVPKLETPRPMAVAPTPQQPPPQTLVDEANYLVDAFAEVLERALENYQGRIKPEEVRSLFLSAYINQSRKPIGKAQGYGDLRDTMTGGSHVA
jgi:hypothetical protein